MTKSITRAIIFTMIAAVCAFIACNDSGAGNSEDVTAFLGRYAEGPGGGGGGECTGYRLTVSATPSAGGTVSLTGTHCYPPGTVVNITARPATGYRFNGWTGASTSIDTTVTVTMNSNQTLSANFLLFVTLTDTRGGQNRTYRTVQIGGRVWMAENLNYATANSWCYNDDPANCTKYGRLYTWDAAMTACPTGWHLPTRQEWEDLVSAVGSNAGTKLKSKAPDWDGTDDFGFSALPGGFRYIAGAFGSAGAYGGWWSATEAGASRAWGRDMGSAHADVDEYYDGKGGGFSVLCSQD